MRWLSLIAAVTTASLMFLSLSNCLVTSELAPNRELPSSPPAAQLALSAAYPAVPSLSPAPQHVPMPEVQTGIPRKELAVAEPLSLSAPAGRNAAAIARQFLGESEYQLQSSGVLRMDNWVPKSKDCANFVSAVLERAGLISRHQRSDSVIRLTGNLRSAGWKDAPLAVAKPGDVAYFDGPHGPSQHVEIYDGLVNGKPQFIGSNNILRDGTQEISIDDGSWAYQYHLLSPP